MAYAKSKPAPETPPPARSHTEQALETARANLKIANDAVMGLPSAERPGFALEVAFQASHLARIEFEVAQARAVIKTSRPPTPPVGGNA